MNDGYEKLLTEGGIGENRENLLKDANTLAERSHRAVVSMFDKERGLMMPKGTDRQPFNGGNGFKDTEWGFGFVEGNAWHHSFPPYALHALAELHGGKGQLLGDSLIDYHSLHTHPHILAISHNLLNDYL